MNKNKNKKLKKPERTLNCDVSMLGSANLAILALSMIDDNGHTHHFTSACFRELEKRGHHIMRGKHNTDEWNMPPEEIAKFVSKFGPSLRDESIEETLFTWVMKIKNPWHK